jgi:hypothetical protein
MQRLCAASPRHGRLQIAARPATSRAPVQLADQLVDPGEAGVGDLGQVGLGVDDGLFHGLAAGGDDQLGQAVLGRDVTDDAHEMSPLLTSTED